MPPRPRALLRAVPFLLIGCGARTTIDQSEYYDDAGFGAGNVSGSGAAGNGGVSAAGGSGSGGISTGGASAGGTSSVGGTGGTSSGGVAGSGGVGGDPMPGRLKAACENFCNPYVAVCPQEYDSANSCALECLGNLADATKPCRRATADALECVAASLNTSLSCEQATLTAYDRCLDQIAATEKCNEMEPPPPPDGCAAMESGSPESCSLTISCSNQSYYVGCYYMTEGESYCECSSNSTGTGFNAEISIEKACAYAAQFCGFPY